MIIRVLRLLVLLRESPEGRLVRRILEETGASRATFYRDIAMLEAAGVPVRKTGVNGEVRYRVEL